MTASAALDIDWRCILWRCTGLCRMGNTLQLVFAVLLLILGVIVAVQGIKKLMEKSK